MRNGKVNAMSELHFKEVAAISKSFYLSKLVQGGDQSGKWIYAGFWADSKSHRRLFFFFLSFSSRYPQKDSPLNKMSAFSIRKQSPNQSGNTESPSFSLWALRAWSTASLPSRLQARPYPLRSYLSRAHHHSLAGDVLAVGFTVRPTSAAKPAVLCVNFCWQRFRPNHHAG